MKSKHFKLLFLLVTLMILSMFTTAFAEEQSGREYSYEWSYSDGKLTLKGYGTSNSHQVFYSNRWDSFVNDITEIEIAKDINYFSEGFDANFDNLQKVTYEGTVDDWLGMAINRNYKLTRLAMNGFVGYYDDKITYFHLYTKKTDKYPANTLVIYGKGTAGWTYMLAEVPSEYKEKVTKVVVEDGVKGLESSSFGYCSNIKTVEIPKSVQVIGSIDLNEGTTIKYAGTQKQWNMIDIQDSSVTACKPQTGGLLGENKIYWSVSKGTLTFEGKGKIESNLYSYTDKDSIKKVVIGEGITEVSERFLDGYDNISSIQFPKTLKTIGNQAFCNLKVTTINLPKVVTIGDDAFQRCSKLKTIKLPVSLKSIGDGAFSYSGVSDSKIKLTYAGTQKQWNNVTVSGFIRNLYPQTEGKLTKNITWKVKSGVLTISGKGAIPEVNVYSDVPWYALRKSIKEVKVGSGITGLGSDFLSGGWGTDEKYNLKKVTIAGTVKKITKGTFEHATIDSIILNNGVTEIEEGAIFACDIKSLTIPGSVKKIGNDAVSDVKSFKYTGTTKQKNALLKNIGNNSNLSFFLVGKISGSCGYAATFTFTKDGILTIKGKGDVTENPWAYSSVQIKKVIIEEGITGIACSFAFETGYEEAQAWIPKSMEYVNSYAFFIKSSRYKLYYASTEAKWKKVRMTYQSDFGYMVAYNCKKTGTTLKAGTKFYEKM